MLGLKGLSPNLLEDGTRIFDFHLRLWGSPLFYSLNLLANRVTVLYPAHLTFYSGVGAGCVRPQKWEPLLTIMFSGLWLLSLCNCQISEVSIPTISQVVIAGDEIDYFDSTKSILLLRQGRLVIWLRITLNISTFHSSVLSFRRQTIYKILFIKSYFYPKNKRLLYSS